MGRVLDLLVALKGNATDDRVFDHDHHQAVAHVVDFNVLEQTGLDQSLETVVDLALVEMTAGAPLEIRADRLDFDAPVTLNLNRRHGLGGGRRRNKRDAQRGGRRHAEHQQRGQYPAPQSHSKIHAQRALVISMPDRTPTNRQIPTCCLACSQFCPSGKQPIAAQFQFHSKTLPIGHATKKPLRRLAEQAFQPRHLM
jgi:hypothetical protein